MARTHYTFEAIGTKWQIEIFEAITKQKLAKVRAAVDDTIALFDHQYSRFRSDSLVTQMARDPGRYILPDDAKPLFDFYEQLYKYTYGAVTPLIGATLEAAGYDADYSLLPGAVHEPPSWEEALEYDFPHLLLKQSAMLDLGAAGKGYLADIVSDRLAHLGMQHFCVNAGGDIVYRTPDEQSLEVALEHPADPTMAIGVARIHNNSLCGSSGNRRSWGKYNHIISPHTLTSPKHIAALWVVADSGLHADGLATALFFEPAVKLKMHFDFEYAIVHDDFSLEHSPGFPARFFTESNVRK